MPKVRRARALFVLLATLAVTLGAVPSVQARPPNDDLRDAIRIRGECRRIIGTFSGATYEDGERGAEGYGSVWYRWTAPSSKAVIVDLRDSAAVGGIDVGHGSTLARLQWIESSPTARGRSFSARRGVTYSIRVTGPVNAARFSLNLEMVRRPPNDDFEGPRRIRGGSGSVRTRNYGATWEPYEPGQGDWHEPARSVWFRWTAPRNGTWRFSTVGSSFDTVLDVFVGRTLRRLRWFASNDDIWPASLALQQSEVVIGGTAGRTYRIRVDGGFWGAVGELSLTWEPVVTAPRNDSFAHPVVIHGSEGEVSGSGSWATREFGEPRSAWNHAERSLWYTWTAPESGPVNFDSIGSASDDPTITVYSGDRMSNLRQIARNRVGDFYRAAKSLAFDADGGAMYRIAVDSDMDPGHFTLRWKRGRPPNDDFANAQRIWGDTGRIPGDTRLATKEDGEGPTYPDTPVPTVWYRWTAPFTGPVEFDAVETTTAQHLLVQTSRDPQSQVADDDDGDGKVRFDAEAGRPYFVRVTGWDYFVMRWRIVWAVDDVPPRVTITSPVGQPTVAGDFTVTAEATDDRSVDRVEFFGQAYSGGTSLGVDRSPPYQISADVSLFRDSTFSWPMEVRAVAYDTSSNMQNSDAVTINVDNSPSETFISSRLGPWRRVRSRTAVFRFWASDAEATFRCSLNGAPFALCPGRHRLRNLVDGTHLLRVRAVDPAGHVDPAPATRTWTVTRTAPC